ncbi:hypothetical protein [Streptomyces sp. NBC_00827]|uniref:hypothetical protein n=1 Tax=Streptomyces sp. NBC_00827 TaxID=2903677 RepID=UPI00386B43EA|nr:hypothetical protein OG569_02130 [Streptomyces sp. NBC_00827]
MGSLKDLIRAANDIKVEEDVEIPEWVPGAKFLVKGLPSGDWEGYQNKLSTMRFETGKTGAAMTLKSNKAEIVAKALFDQDSGELVFPDLREGIAILSEKSGGTVNGLFNLVRHLSGNDRDFQQKLKDAEGNSDGDQN